MPAHQRQVAGIDGPGRHEPIPSPPGRHLQPVPDLEEVLCKELLRDGRRVDADTLPHGDEVRRGEEARLAQGGMRVLILGEDGVDKGAGAAFAFGPCYVNYLEAIQVCWLLAMLVVISSGVFLFFRQALTV